jgi:glutaminase
MTTCGMYDFTGEWVYRVGLPAKSGVGGGIMAVLPGQLGIGVFSPALDERGNSVRGVKACEAISRDLGLHFLQPPRASVSTVRARYTLAEVRSKRRRTGGRGGSQLDRHGAQARVYELQGDLRFATLEPVLRASSTRTRPLHFARARLQARDPCRRCGHPPAGRLIGSCRRGQHVVLTRVRRGDLLDALDAEVDPRTRPMR